MCDVSKRGPNCLGCQNRAPRPNEDAHQLCQNPRAGYIAPSYGACVAKMRGKGEGDCKVWLLTWLTSPVFFLYTAA